MFYVYACQSPIEAPCPMHWGDLEPTDSEMVRHCAVCDRTVHLCMSEEDMHEHVAAGRCVAVWVDEPGFGGRLMLGGSRLPDAL